MRKSTKGAVAASLAAMLLIGAWGTQASWSDNQELPGTAVKTGHLKLTGGCDDWLIKVDLDDPQLVTFNPGTQPLAPGDLLQLNCEFTVDALGVNVHAKLTTSTPGLTGGDAASLVTALPISTAFTRNGTAVNASTVLNDNDIVTAVVSVQVPAGLTNAQDLATTIQDITITATQA